MSTKNSSHTKDIGTHHEKQNKKIFSYLNKKNNASFDFFVCKSRVGGDFTPKISINIKKQARMVKNVLVLNFSDSNK